MIGRGLFAIAAGSTFLVTIIVSLVLRRVWGPTLRDRNDGRQIGGIAVGLGINCGLTIGVFAGMINPLVVVGAGLIFLLGVLDDAIDLSPWRKLVGQSVAAAIATIGIGRLAMVTIAGAHVTVGTAGAILTFFWVLTLINGVNLIDGLDGLAVGVSVFPAIGLLIGAVIVGSSPGILVGAVILGGLIGFYPWNRFRARLLLGDTGAELIGYMLAVASVLVFTGGVQPVPVIPVLSIFAFPIADTIFAVIRRVYHHRAVFHGDHEHIHHRLAGAVGERTAISVLIVVSAVTTGIGVVIWLCGG